VDVGTHDGRAGGHRLQEHDAEGFTAGRRRGVHIGRPEQLGLLRVGHAAQELDALQAAGGHVAARLALLRPGADHQEARLGARLAQDAMGLEQVQQALARLVATDEQDVRRPVLPARDRHGTGEARDVDAVGDHLVIARKEPVDEVPGRGTDRDPTMQPVGVALHHSASELVRGREAGVGVECGHVDRVRFAQQEERQEGHERLVEMEHVELLTVQHRPDLGQVARREGERPDRRVDGHGDAHAETDDVAFRGALRTVAGGQDADVVAAQPQVLVQVADVLGHAPVLRVDVRTDQADLHRASGSKRGGRWRPPG